MKKASRKFRKKPRGGVSSSLALSSSSSEVDEARPVEDGRLESRLGSGLSMRTMRKSRVGGLKFGGAGGGGTTHGCERDDGPGDVKSSRFIRDDIEEGRTYDVDMIAQLRKETFAVELEESDNVGVFGAIETPQEASQRDVVVEEFIPLKEERSDQEPEDAAEMVENVQNHEANMADESSDEWEREQLRRAGKGNVIEEDAWRKASAILRQEESAVLDPDDSVDPDTEWERCVEIVEKRVSGEEQKLQELDHQRKDLEAHLQLGRQERDRLEAAAQLGADRFAFFSQLCEYLSSVGDMLSEKCEEIDSRLDSVYSGWELEAGVRDRKWSASHDRLNDNGGLVSLNEVDHFNKSVVEGLSGVEAGASVSWTGGSDVCRLSDVDEREEVVGEEPEVPNIFADADEEYCDFGKVLRSFAAWRSQYPKEYLRAFGDDSISRLASLFLKAELSEHSGLRVKSMSVLETLMQFLGGRDSTDAVRLLTPILEKFILNLIRWKWDVESRTSTENLIYVIEQYRHFPRVTMVTSSLQRVSEMVRERVGAKIDQLRDCGQESLGCVGEVVECSSLVAAAISDMQDTPAMESFFFESLLSEFLIPHARSYVERVRGEEILGLLQILSKSLPGRWPRQSRAGWLHLRSFLGSLPSDASDGTHTLLTELQERFREELVASDRG